MQNIAKARVKGRRVIIRVDMNVPFDAKGRILDDFRIRASLDSILFILSRGGRIFIILHRGRPKGRDPKLSVEPIRRRLARLLGRPVLLVKNPLKESPQRFRNAPIILCENIRFFRGEDENSPTFAKALARWGDIYVNDAFSVSHRRSASVVGLPNILPSYAGLLLIKEVKTLNSIFKNPAHPFIAIFGGAKISTKIPYIRDFLKKADEVIIGGALLNTVLGATGREVGVSLVERVMYKEATNIARSAKIYLPTDVLLLKKGSRKISEVGRKDYIIDIGEESAQVIAKKVLLAKTVLWNGPLGNTDIHRGGKATKRVFAAIRKTKARVALGGGDLGGVLKTTRRAKKIYVSTAGGAMLEFIAKGNLPGLKALGYK